MKYRCNKDLVINNKTVAKPGETIVISEDGQVYNMASGFDIKVDNLNTILPYLDNIHDEPVMSQLDKFSAFENITNEMFETYKKKNHDYGDSFTKSLSEWGLQAAAFRMDDKMNRFKSIVKNGCFKIKDESIMDTLKDLATYCVMTVMYLENNH